MSTAKRSLAMLATAACVSLGTLSGFSMGRNAGEVDASRRHTADALKTAFEGAKTTQDLIDTRAQLGTSERLNDDAMDAVRSCTSDLKRAALIIKDTAADIESASTEIEYRREAAAACQRRYSICESVVAKLRKTCGED